jgi:acetyl esterase/lipase
MTRDRTNFDGTFFHSQHFVKASKTMLITVNHTILASIATFAMSTSDMDSIPLPHSSWRHPHKSWLDIIIGFVVSFLIPLHKIADTPPHEPSDHLARARGGSIIALAGVRMAMSACMKTWSNSSRCMIAQYILHVPRRNLLEQWGFENCKLDKVPPGDIAVYFYFPIALVEGKDGVTTNGTTEFGVQNIDLDNVDVLPLDVPLTIFFHGGAFVIGDAHSSWVSLVPPLLEESSKPFIIASVEYSLAPEYPFPTAVEEALTVVSYILDKCPRRKVHLSGISAGGSLSAVATMECHRRYPGRISSSLIGTAYIDPKGDSLSYYMNSSSSHLPTVGFLRWGWQAYLGLPLSKDDKTDKVTSMAELLAIKSNRTTWDECKWKGTKAERLINPVIDLPNLKGPNAPQFIITMNRADPLMDECLDLVAKIKAARAKVTHIDHIGVSVYALLHGSHCVICFMLATYSASIPSSTFRHIG